MSTSDRRPALPCDCLPAVLQPSIGDEEGALIHTMQLPGSTAMARMKLVTGPQGGYWGGQYAPNNTQAATLPGCGAGCLFNIVSPAAHAEQPRPQGGAAA